jgi:hypothetical protein
MRFSFAANVPRLPSDYCSGWHLVEEGREGSWRDGVLENVSGLHVIDSSAIPDKSRQFRVSTNVSVSHIIENTAL